MVQFSWANAGERILFAPLHQKCLYLESKQFSKMLTSLLTGWLSLTKEFSVSIGKPVLIRCGRCGTPGARMSTENTNHNYTNAVQQTQITSMNSMNVSTEPSHVF